MRLVYFKKNIHQLCQSFLVTNYDYLFKISLSDFFNDLHLIFIKYFFDKHGGTSDQAAMFGETYVMFNKSKV